ncbi:MAG TPA: tetratricopeptide repeat protein, partial [Saprospiraceae bacterium]|nr:tetratricopeptide repeat protein [Saprospiraceae bacterium]
LWVSAFFFLLACLSKSAAAVLPLVLLVADGWLGRSFSLRLLTEKAAFFAIALGFGALTLYSRTQAGHTGTETAFSLSDRFWMVAHTLPFYWGKILWPSGLSIWYPFEKVNGSWPLAYLLAPVAVLALGGLAWRFRRSLPVLWWGLLWYLAHISLSLPWATFGTFELRSDRYNYLAALGVFAVLAALPAWVAARRPAWATAAWALLLIFAAGCAVQSVRRIGDWKDTLTLLNKAIATEGDNFGKAYLWRGMEYGDMQKRDAAIEDFNRAIAINPALTEAYKYRGGMLGMSGKHEQALADLNVYLEKNPDDAEYRFNRGIALRKLGRPREAIADFDRTLQLRPDFSPAYRARANAHADLGDSEKAQADMAEFERRSGTAKK